MDERDWLAERFQAHRPHLRAVAYRMLGSLTEADDAVQGTWLRLARADPREVHNLGGWLTTLVARECLDMLRARTARREEPLGVHLPDPVVSQPPRLWTSLVSARASRSQVPWTASSASVREPSIR